jgi:AraC-like DNA-binding protein
MLNFYRIVKENLNFNRFEYRDTVCLEYTCPIEAEQIGIFSRNDYVVYVLSGKKTYKTLTEEWTLIPGQTLYLKKGAEVIHQFFDDEYCMLGFFLSDELIRETYKEVKGKIALSYAKETPDFEAIEVEKNSFLDGYFYSMLNYFRDINRPPDQIMVLKLKELLITLMNGSPELAAYFHSMEDSIRPSLHNIMEKNFRFNLKLEDYAELSHRSLSSFKREFQDCFHESPGKWLLKRRAKHAALLLAKQDLSISEVAFDSGFENLSHFSRVFKKIIGISPSEYQKTRIEA